MIPNRSPTVAEQHHSAEIIPFPQPSPPAIPQPRHDDIDPSARGGTNRQTLAAFALLSAITVLSYWLLRQLISVSP